MWCFALLLLVGAVVANSGHEHAWETGKQYQYLVRSRTLSTLDQLNDQSSGILIRAVLTIQATTSDKLQATLTVPQFARIHTQLLEGHDTLMSDQQLEYQELPLSGKPFEIVVKHGLVRDLVVDKNVPTWELNLLKGIVSQLQVDTQGENAIHDHSTQEPKDGHYYASYKTMEDTVGGKCEVLYDISPLSVDDRYHSPELAPLLKSHMLKNEQLIDIRKTKNYNNCRQQRGYHLGHTGRMSLTQGSKYNTDKLTTKSSDSRIVISGELKRFTIQSSVTSNNIFIKSEDVTNSYIGTVYSKMNLTLVNMDKITNELVENRDNLVSTGNLLYTYNNPLTEIELGKKHQETISRNSQQVQSSESNSSERKNRKNVWHEEIGSDSATSSSEEFHHVQTVPSLHEAPKSMTPLGLAFQDNQESLNVVQEAQKMAHQITSGLEQSNNLINHDTLEYFINFVNVLRLMNHNQIVELEQNILSSLPQNSQSDENSHVKNNPWNVLRDGVAQAGTGPALLTIVKWIQNGLLKSTEAARVVSKIPKVVRIPSETYIEAVFEHIVVDQKVQQQEFLNKIAPLAFSELVRNAQVNKRHSQNTYPIYNFGKLNSETDKAVTETYIPYMEKQLHKYIKNGDNAQAQAYIVALGNFGHSKVLKVFEPFLEGQEKVSTYLRTLMVSSLRSLVRRSPDVVAPVLYKIYLNEQESHEVRCAAVHLYMLTDPPLVTMLRMAKHTNFDKSNEVTAAVKSSIISLSKWNQPEFAHLTQKARSAKRLLTSKKFSATTSRGTFTNTAIVQVIGSDDTNIPKNLYMIKQNAFYNIAKTVLEAEYGVSSVKRLIEIFEKPEVHQESAWLDNIRQSLGMQARTAEQVEGNLKISTIFGTDFYPFDQQSIEKFASYVHKILKENKHVQFNRLDSYEEIVSFPTENGMPFTYTVEVPKLMRAYFSKKNVEGHNKATNGIVNVLVANKVQTRFGVVVAHEHLHYIAGVDKNSLVHLPIEYNVNVESEKHFHNYKLTMRVDPEEQSSPLRLAHRSVIPFTAQVDMMKIVPVARGNARRLFNLKEQKKSTVRVGTIQIVSEGDSEEMELNPGNIYQWWTSVLDNSLQYKKIEVFNLFQSGNDAHHETVVNVAYDELEIQGDHNKEHGNLISVVDIVDKQPNSATRRKQLMEEVSKGIKSVKTYVYDISIQVPFLKTRQILTIGVGQSNVERKQQYIAYWSHQSQTGEVVYEALITGTVQSTQNEFLSYDKAAHQLPEDEFTMTLRIGENYKTAEKIHIQGRLLRSDSLTETMLKSKPVQQCLHEMRLGKGLQVCQKAIDLALKKNLLQMSIKMDSDEHNNIGHLILSYINEIVPNVNMELTKNPHLKNEIKMEVKMSPNYENAETTLKTPEMNLKFQLHDSEDQMSQDNENEGFEDEEEEASCTVSKNEVVTFDQRTYPLYMGGIWHVLLFPDQLQILNHLDMQPIPENMKVSVMAREVNNRIQVRVLVGEKEYMLQQSGDRLQSLINGQEITLSKERSHQDKVHGKIIAEVFIQPDNSLMLNLQNHGITIVYDGKTVQLVVIKNYRNAIRGLCGNYDKQARNDFVSPQNCVLQKPEEFSATYALLDKETEDTQAQKTIAKNKEKANRATCTPLTTYQTNVINDREAGRTLGKLVWGYHENRNQNKKTQGSHHMIYRTKIEEDDQEICFSIRPVPTCDDRSLPAQTKTKSVAMHCMPMNDAAAELKRRILQGANPDLSHKSVSRKQNFVIPIDCY